jgi:iron complex outermembrane receptor protein
MRTISVGLTVIGVMLSSIPVYSAATPEREALLFAEIPEVVTASKVPQSIMEAPASMDVITSRDIERLGLRNLGDALFLFSGIDIIDVTTSQIFSPRGLNGKFENSALVLLDGHPYYDIMGQVEPAKISLSNVERIELVKGPGSALYGANAFTGVINIITKSPYDYKVDGTKVTGGRGNWETQKEELVFSKQKRDLGNLFTFWHYSTFAAGTHRISDNDDREDYNVFDKIIYKDLVISMGYNTEDSGKPGTVYMPLRVDRVAAQTGFVHLDYRYRVSPFMDVKLRTQYYGDNLRMHSEDIDYMTGASLGVRDTGSNNYRVNFELQGDYQVLPNNLIIIGAESRDENVDGVYFGGTQRMLNRGVHLQDEWRPVNRLSLTLGGRYDKPTAYEENFSPRVSAVYTINDRAVWKSSYGEAFKAPTFTSLFVDTWEYGGWIHFAGNPNLKPERLKTIDTSLLYSFSDSLKANLSLFYTDTRDAIVQTGEILPGGINGLYQETSFTNLGEAEIRGGEFEVAYRVASFLRTIMTYSYQDAKDKATDTALVYAPRSKANLRLDFDFGKGFQLSTLSYYIGASEEWVGQVGEHFINNARLSWQANDNLSVGITGFNIFDVLYGGSSQYTAPGRIVLADVTYRFPM